MNNSKNILLLVLGLVVLIGGIFMLSDRADNQGSSVEIPESWEIYSTTTFSISHPSEAEIENEAGNVKIQLLGEENTPNTEVTDGFTFFVKTDKLSESASLSDFINDKYESEVEVLKSVQAPTSTKIGKRDAFKYIVESQLETNSTNLVIEAEDNNVFVVSYTISDPNDQGYEEIVNKMMKTLEIN